jgi:predicted nucleic acid-binding protein
MSSYIVVDTDVFSCLWQHRAVSHRFTEALRNTVPVLSFVTVAEVRFGARNANWGERRLEQLNAALRPYVVAPYSTEMATLWGDLKHEARRLGLALGQPAHSNDLWICATAIHYNAPLMTNNVKHFESIPNLHLIER